MRTRRTNTSQIPKPFMSFIIIPQLAQLLTILRSPKRLLVVLSPILCSPTEYLPCPLWHFASPTSHHYRPQLTKHQKHMAWLTYGWLLPITFTVSTGQCKPLSSPRGCRFGSRFESNSQAITTSSHWSLPKAFSLLHPHCGFPMGNMTSLLSAKQSKVTGHQVASQVCFGV